MFDLNSNTDSRAFAQECARVEAKEMGPRKAIVKVAADIANTSEEEREYLEDLVMRVEYESAPPPGFVTPDSIRNFRSPSGKYVLDFSSARSKPQDLFGPYFDGTVGPFKGKRTMKSTVARYGHLNKSAAENFSKVFSKKDNDRKVTFEYMAICCLYFHVEPAYAVTLFHKCTNLDELTKYKTLGGALWLFLEDKCYDYEEYVRKCCKAIKDDNGRLPEFIAGSQYWNEVYDET